MTKSNGTTRSAFTSPAKTRAYRPGFTSWPHSADGHRGFYSVQDGMAMRRDPRVRYALRVLFSPLASVKWKVHAHDREAGEMADAAFRKAWTRHLRAFFRCAEFGWSPGELQYDEDEAGDVVFDRFDDIMPLDARPLRCGRELSGLYLVGQGAPPNATRARRPGEAPAHWVQPPRSLWITHEGEGGSFYGRGRLEGMWLPWMEKVGRHGALDIRRMWFLKNAYAGHIIRYPDGITTTEDGREVNNRDLAQEVAERAETGHELILPADRDPETGDYLWTIERPEIHGEASGLIDYVNELDEEIFEGAEIPLEVVEAATSGSGWSGRSVPFLVFLAGVDSIADAIAHNGIWPQMVAPLVAANRGEKAARGVRLELAPLSEMMEDDGAKEKGKGGGGDGSGGLGQQGLEGQQKPQPPQQSQQPPPNVQMSWDGDDGQTIVLSLDDAVQLAADAVKRNAGDKWEGKNGRWFTKREDGRVVPTKAPGGGDAPKREKPKGDALYRVEERRARLEAQQRRIDAQREKVEARHRKITAVDRVSKSIEDKRAAGKLSAKDMHELAGELLDLTVAQLDELKAKLGIRAGGLKYEKASKIAAAALKSADTKRAAKAAPKKEKKADERPADDGPGGGGVRVPDANAGRPVAGETGQAGSPGATEERKPAAEPARRTTTDRVPADQKEIERRLDRFEKFFDAKGQGHVAGWIRTLKDHVDAVGGEAALAALAGSASGGEGKGDVQYWGVGTEEANWKNMGHFMEAYLARNGIIAVTGDASSPDAPLVSALGAPDRYVAGQDFKPAGMHFTDKLSEAKTLPGLETSEDISKVMGKPVTHLTDEVTAKLDAQYGKGQWIVKCYDDNAAAGYGIFFPQRAAAITQDARNTMWDAGSNLGKYGFKIARDPDTGKAVGLQHETGDTYPFGSEEYLKTIDGDARHWGDRAAAAAANERGAMLPEGSFMVQPAFPAVGISDADRAAGKTWHEKNEGRVHLVTRQDGSVEVIPHSTWLKGGNLPVVFEDDDTRAMAAAAKAAIEKIPHEARKGQVYAPDIMKTKDGYAVVELNAQGDNNGSGYLHDNHFTIDAYTSYLTGRAPAHVAFIRQLLTTKKKGEKAAEKKE